MNTREIAVQRVSVVSSNSFDGIMAHLDAKIGHPEMNAFGKAITAAPAESDMAKVVQAAIRSTGLMEFMRFDIGGVLRKEQGPKARKSLRLVVGNPLIMKEMAKLVPDAGSYAPVTILVDERPDGVHLSYDRMATFLAPYGNDAASQVARDLDAKVEALLTAAAGARVASG
jgi:uncharacterized protein (DUF302 family)